MPSCSKHEVILVHYPFTDLSSIKVRPALVIHAPHPSQDNIIVPLTSQVTGLRAGEFLMTDWRVAGLNVPTAIKRGIYTIHPRLVVKQLGKLSSQDAQQLERHFGIGLVCRLLPSGSVRG